MSAIGPKPKRLSHSITEVAALFKRKRQKGQAAVSLELTAGFGEFTLMKVPVRRSSQFAGRAASFTSLA
jgi:hypothetical protein